jgi:vacuolar iron transporter family protein
MAAGEYVSVSSSRDTEKALLEKERYNLEHFPKRELDELIAIYKEKGLTEKTSELVAQELSKKDVFAAHAHMELSIDPNNLTSPWHAAFASSGSFLLGSLIPLIAIVIPPTELKVPVAFIAVVIALAITGVLSAKAGGANVTRATIRVVTGGALAMVVTYGIGKLFSISGL